MRRKPHGSSRRTAPPTPHRRRRWLRWLGACVLFLLALLGVAVAILLANPLERPVQADLVDLAPVQAPVFLRLQDLETTFEEVRQTPLWDRLVSQRGWRDLVAAPAPGTGLPDRYAALRRVLEEIDASPQLQRGILLVLEDLLGADAAVIAHPQVSGEQLDLTLMTRVGYLTKLAFGSLELFGVRMGLLGEEQLGPITLERQGPRHLLIRGVPGLPRPLHLFRERDLLLFSTRSDAVLELRKRLAVGGEAPPSLRQRQPYLRVMGPLQDILPRARCAAYLDWDLLARRGLDLEATVRRVLGPDVRALLFESMDFAGWRSVGLAIPPDRGLVLELVVAQQPSRGSESATLQEVYRSAPSRPVTLTPLPGDVAVAKTTLLPFDSFFDLTFGRLEPKTRGIINFYVLDQLQSKAAEIAREYADLIGYLTGTLGAEFTVFAIPARFTPQDQYSMYLPRVGVVFPARHPEGVQQLVQDITEVLPEINPDLFKPGQNQLTQLEDVTIYQVQSEFAPLRSLFGIAPVFVISDEYVMLLSSSELLDEVRASLARGAGEVAQALDELGGPGHGYYYADGQHLYQLLVDHWRNEALVHESVEADLVQMRRRELLQQMAQELGAARIQGSGELRAELEEMVTAALARPDEQERLREQVERYVAPIHQAYLTAIEPVRLVDKVVLSARYAPSRLSCTIRITGR